MHIDFTFGVSLGISFSPEIGGSQLSGYTSCMSRDMVIRRVFGSGIYKWNHLGCGKGEDLCNQIHNKTERGGREVDL